MTGKTLTLKEEDFKKLIDDFIIPCVRIEIRMGLEAMEERIKKLEVEVYGNQK